MERKIKKIRKKLDKITNDLISLLAVRKGLVLELAKLKKKNRLPIFDKAREEEAFKMAQAAARKKGVNTNLVKKIIKLLMEDAKKIQKEK